MCHAQGYDEASNMKELASEIKTIELTARHLHCFAHFLNLALADNVKSVIIMSDTLDHYLEICKMIKSSLESDTTFSQLKGDLVPVRPGL